MDPQEVEFLEAGLRPVRPKEVATPGMELRQDNCKKCGTGICRHWVNCKHCGTKLDPEEPNGGGLSQGVTTGSQEGSEPGEDSEEEEQEDEDCREEGEEGRAPVAVREVVKASQKERRTRGHAHTI